jgi:hypothetical protein
MQFRGVFGCYMVVDKHKSSAEVDFRAGSGLPLGLHGCNRNGQGVVLLREGDVSIAGILLEANRRQVKTIRTNLWLPKMSVVTVRLMHEASYWTVRFERGNK